MVYTVTVENALFTRHGDTPVEPQRVKGLDTKRPYVVTSVKCCRCGGSGIYSQHHGTCYRCGGRGATPADTYVERVYTAEQQAALNAAQAKRADAKAAKAQAACDATNAQFEAARADLLASIPAEWLDGSALHDAEGGWNPNAPREALTVTDIISKGRRFGSISDKQAALVQSLVDGYRRRQAEQAQRAATSQHVGRISERLTVDVVCVRHATYERADRFRYYAGTETVHICQFEDAAGNVLVTKSPRFRAEQGARGTLTGTVKQHDVYRDVKQTVLLRATFAPAALSTDNQQQEAIQQ